MWREEFTYMKFGRSYTVTLPRRSVFIDVKQMKVFFTLSFRIGTNDSVDQIFLFLHHHFLYHVYVHDPRLNQSFHPNHHLLLKGYDKSMHAKASVLAEEERVYLFIHLCRQHDLNLPYMQFS